MHVLPGPHKWFSDSWTSTLIGNLYSAWYKCLIYTYTKENIIQCEKSNQIKFLCFFFFWSWHWKINQAHYTIFMVPMGELQHIGIRPRNLPEHRNDKPRKTVCTCALEQIWFLEILLVKNWSDVSKYRLCILPQISMLPVGPPSQTQGEHLCHVPSARLVTWHILKITEPVAKLGLRHFLKSLVDLIKIQPFQTRLSWRKWKGLSNHTLCHN